MPSLQVARIIRARDGQDAGGSWMRLVAVLLAIAAGCGMSACKKSPTESPGAAAAAVTQPAGPAKKTAAVPEPVQKVLGKWMRADGGYVLEIRGADMSGVLDAGYFNPKPINVSRAIWMQGGSGFQIVIELNDVGYPGATYVLSHDAKSDQLVGQYNQPAMQQSFDISFVRQPKP
jgi:hypothetical protein